MKPITRMGYLQRIRYILYMHDQREQYEKTMAIDCKAVNREDRRIAMRLVDRLIRDVAPTVVNQKYVPVWARTTQEPDHAHSPRE